VRVAKFSIRARVRAVSELSFEDQQPTSIGGLVVFQELFSFLRAKHLRQRFVADGTFWTPLPRIPETLTISDPPDRHLPPSGRERPATRSSGLRAVILPEHPEAEKFRARR
jgi:hypothetical protein